MKRHQLEHIIRAAAGNADTNDIVIIGSQAILGSIENPPEELTESIEADVFPKSNPTDSELIEGAMGEGSMFHERFGYYGHGVGPETPTLPDGAWDRLVPLQNENTRGATGWCLEIHDLAVSKLCAGREKDLDYVATLVRHKLVKPDIVTERLQTILNEEVKPLAEARWKGLLEKSKNEQQRGRAGGYGDI